jgi:inner membrane protein
MDSAGRDTGFIGRLKGSAGVRLVIIGVLTMIFLIPLGMVKYRIWEREGRRNTAVSEVSQKWGRAQTVAGPVLSVPYLTHHKDSNHKPYTVRHLAHFLPGELDISGTLDSEMRYRGIFEVLLYSGELSLSGHFTRPDVQKLNIPEQNVLWDESYLSVGLSDMKGIQDTITIDFAGSELTAEPGARLDGTINSGINTPVKIGEETELIPFTVTMKLRGSETLDFIPMGEVTTVKLSGDWGSPSFTGEFLPATREIKDEAFSAAWKVLHLNRNFPQAWKDSDKQIYNSAFGVKLLVPADGYQRTERTVKYSIMFIFLTFMTFFLIEILNGKAVHPIQYLLVGSALVVFYILVLALSEHILFNTSYLIASAATVLMIALYTRSVLGSGRLALAVSGIVSMLYGYLLIVLQAEDYALLLGSVGLFVILGLTMYLTRKVDWFSVLERPAEFEVVG